MEKHEAALEAAKARMASQRDAMGLQIDLENMNKRMAEIKQMRQVPVYNQGDIAYRIQREVASFKENHPTYDASQFQKESDDFVAFLENNLKNEDQARNDANDFRTAYDNAFIGLLSFRGNVQTGNEEADRLKNRQKLKDLEAKLNQFLGTDLAKKAETLHSGYIDNNILAELTRKATSNDEKVAQHKKWVFEAYRKGDNWISYDELLALEIFWESNSALFPSHVEYKTALDNTRKAIAECGSEENMEQIRQKNYGKYLTTVTMQPAGANDAAIEADIKRVFLTTPAGQNANVVKVNILYPNWAIKRHDISGIIVSREREALVVTKDANGRCWVHQFGVFQRHDGNNYSASEKLFFHPTKTEILCENVR
ncbi:MAG: hypothetical protein KA239_07645 [Bacteroidia bacterium]|nr:hypothetical protein [Bacteroidia bacterium]